MTQEGEKDTAVYVEDFYGETQRQGHVLVFFFFFPPEFCGCAHKEESIGFILRVEY